MLLFGILVGGAVWAVLTSLASGGSPSPVATIYVACLLSLIISEFVSRRIRLAVPVLVAVAIAVVAWRFRYEFPHPRPLAPPLAYTNADGQLFLQGAIAALMVTAAADRALVRVAAAILSATLGLATIVTGSTAAALLLVLPLGALVVGRQTAVRRVLGVFAGLLLAVVVTTTLIGIGAHLPVTQLAGEVLSPRRPMLWHEAIVLAVRHPLVGIGPGEFATESATARSDPDARWAHNGFLQQAAEEGAIGFALILGGFLLVFVKLQSIDRPDRVTALAGSSVAALGIHACLDYVLHFPVLPVIAAAMVGVGVATTAAPPAAQREGDTREHARP